MTGFFANPAIRITLITAVMTAILAMIKLIVGHIGASQALMADGVHSLSDLLIDTLVLGAAHYGGQKADVNHPYGHGRIETAATFGLALLLIVTGFGIIWEAARPLIQGSIAQKPNAYVLWVALITIIINEALFRYTLVISKKIKSSLLEANAWHNRSDAAAAVVVLLSISGALLGFHYMDAIGAIIVGLMVGKMGGDLAWRSITELVDTGVEPSMIETIQKIIVTVPGVRTLHQLRTRTINKNIVLDVHILVAPRISVSEGHYIGDQVILALIKQLPTINDITVHVDPEDDETAHPSADLPDRPTLTAMLTQQFHNLPFSDQIQAIQLHYLNGKIDIDVFLPVKAITHDEQNPETLIQLYQSRIQDIVMIRKLTLMFRL